MNKYKQILLTTLHYLAMIIGVLFIDAVLIVPLVMLTIVSCLKFGLVGLLITLGILVGFLCACYVAMVEE